MGSLRWLPHFWDENKQTRYLAFTKEDAHNLCEYFHEIVKQRKREMQAYSYGKSKLNLPCYVFIFGSKRYMEMEQIMSDLFMDEPAMESVHCFYLMICILCRMTAK